MSRFRGTGALVLWIDVDPPLQAEADAWYVDEHLPERIAVAGYRRAMRYVAVSGSPRYLSVFEAQTPEALASDGYLGLVRRISDQSRRIRAGFSGVVRNTFRVRASAGRAVGAVVGSFRLVPAGTAAGTAGGTAGATVGDAAPGPSSALDGLGERLLAGHCIVGVHWLEAVPQVRAAMDAVRAVGGADGAIDHVLLVEVTQVEEIESLRAGPLSDDALREAGWTVAAFGIYRLLCAFDQSDIRDAMESP